MDQGSRLANGFAFLQLQDGVMSTDMVGMVTMVHGSVCGQAGMYASLAENRVSLCGVD